MVSKKNVDRVSLKQQTSRAVSSVDQIREFFSENTELFSDPDQIMPAILDGQLCLDMIATVAVAQQPQIKRVLDLGCGGGNASNLLLQKLQSKAPNLRNQLPDVNLTLVDLSREMLQTAEKSLAKRTSGIIKTHAQDIRKLSLKENHYDVILCSLVLHHLRHEREWLDTYKQLHTALRPGASLFVFDLVDITSSSIHQDAYTRYGQYLSKTVDDEYRDFVFDHIKQEDTPRSLLWQIDQLRAIGFSEVDILHKHLCYAAFNAIK
ncbi:ubiquinone/menaquinone biosynthesis methyltransferase [Poriferisphaera corsica]|uniref:Ubiquinone/menaquinone biosynthesis methyltransferase n=1 Tax=Poriferisphaera corsica TaxID=2528020 RepID=A0A517YW71_9BACT|nr:class I SAM-dependent methyltransferase [Poriferisphaera corsica]QDU34484.1 ubiquinone/menaquinone biosynthesis methyltransferase [Poriferisphaera corsica]